MVRYCGGYLAFVLEREMGTASRPCGRRWVAALGTDRVLGLGGSDTLGDGGADGDLLDGRGDGDPRSADIPDEYAPTMTSRPNPRPSRDDRLNRGAVLRARQILERLHVAVSRPRPIARGALGNRGLLLTASLLALALGVPESVSAARNGLIAYSVDEGEQTCDQCGPQGESLPLLGGAWVETVRSDGTDRRRIRCAYRQRACRYRDPVFSHDGRRLAVGSRDGLVVLTPSGNQVLRLKHEDAFVSPTWAPGNRKLAFTRSLSPPEKAPDGTYAFGIFLTDLRGRTRLLKNADTFSVTWSKRGLLAWASPPPFNRWPDIWVGKPDGSGRRRIARRGDTPAWSPDGHSVAFICRREARGLCVVSASGGGARFITRRCTYGWDDYTGIAWSPDGREIACEGKRGGLIAVNLGTRAVRAIVPPRRMRGSIQEIDWQPIRAIGSSRA